MLQAEEGVVGEMEGGDIHIQLIGSGTIPSLIVYPFFTVDQPVV